MYECVFVFAFCDCLFICLYVVLCMHGHLGMHVLQAVNLFSWLFKSIVGFFFLLTCGNCLLWSTWPLWLCARVLWIFQFQVFYMTPRMTLQLTCFNSHFWSLHSCWSLVYNRCFVIFWLILGFFFSCWASTISSSTCEILWAIIESAAFFSVLSHCWNYLYIF